MLAMMTIKEQILEEVTLKVRATIREAREAYNGSYGYAKKVLAIPEISEALKLYLEKHKED